MDWVPVITTVVGAVIGIGSTLLVDRSRSRIESDRQWEELKRHSYVEFLVALNHTQQALCSVAYARDLNRDARAAAARDAFRTNGIYSACEQVMIVAPEAIRAAANRTFNLLQEFRDRLDAAEVDLELNRGKLNEYRSARDELRDQMHTDLRRAGRTSGAAESRIHPETGRGAVPA